MLIITSSILLLKSPDVGETTTIMAIITLYAKKYKRVHVQLHYVYVGLSIAFQQR